MEVGKVVQSQNGLGRPARVLLVQDEPGGTRAAAAMLRAVWPGGLIICQAQTVEDGVHELTDHGATCVLLGLHGMAGTSGSIEAVRQLSAAAPETPILVLVDAPDEEAGLLTVRAGAQDQLAWTELSPAILRRSVSFAVERKRTEAALAQQALQDALTGLPNRALFLDHLRGALDRSQRHGGAVTVLFLDVDDFKEVNDSLGHAAGDRLLTVLADRFRGLLRPMDTVARYGGDEFTFLFEGLEGEREAELVARRISRCAGAVVGLGDRQRTVAVSIGIAIVTDPQLPIEEVIRRADAAMYRAKELSGDRVGVYDDQMAGSVKDGEALERQLRQAVGRAELRLHFQPHVSLDADTGLAGLEALVRWAHPDWGLLEPPHFIGLAEQTGLILPIGDWVLEEALRQAARWRESRPQLTISVNLSARELADPELVRRLESAISGGDHDPGMLCLEVSERAVAAQPEQACRQLAALNELGVKLAIDDFGTGDCTPTTVAQLPVHALKVDRELVARMDTSAVGAAVSLGHSLGLTVVAEGVETDAQLAAVRELGCDGAQGYLFSRPMPKESIHG
ncbi:MAG: putative bifunctional diguanylate cyclase/phosphodiesterase, partial [Solirubrobacteraceae bacterium]